MNPGIFTDDYVSQPFWWDRTPRPPAGNPDLPESADVVIVGSGYTGLSAAAQTARHGLDTVVLDAQDAGWGCSSRNGGQISTSIKPSFGELREQYGKEAALAILTEGNNALNWVEQVVRENNIDCNFRRVGRFYGAHSGPALDMLRRKLADTPDELKLDAYVIGPEEQRSEIGSDFYHGGLVNPLHASVDPGRYHQGLYECARASGAEIIARCAVTNIQRQAPGFVVHTEKGRITAREIILATSGYTGKLSPWQRARIIPIGSYIIATEPVPKELIDRLMPKDRVITDTLKLVVYYRTCPQKRRILFGGRVSIKETNPRICAPRLRELMIQRFPELSGFRISHSWMGFVGYTFDQLPHTGVRSGVHYSMGYCGSGISLSSYLGAKTGLRVAGQPEGKTALDDLKFPSRPYYWGNPWFLAPSIFYYRWKDRTATRS